MTFHLIRKIGCGSAARQTQYGALFPKTTETSANATLALRYLFAEAKTIRAEATILQHLTFIFSLYFNSNFPTCSNVRTALFLVKWLKIRHFVLENLNKTVK